MNNVSGDRRNGGIAGLLRIIFPQWIFNVRLASVILLALVFLLPIVGSSGSLARIHQVKLITFESLVILSSFIVLFSYLRERSFSLPKSFVFLFSWLGAVFFVLAAAFSPVPRVSFFGIGSEMDTAMIVVLVFAALLLSALLFFTPSRLKLLRRSFIVSVFVLIAYQILHFILPTYTLTQIVSVESPLDLGVLSGGVALLSFIAPYFFAEKKQLRIWSMVALIFVLPVLIAIDSFLLWIVLGLFSGIFLFVTMSDIISVSLRVHDPRKHTRAFMVALASVSRSALIGFLLFISFAFGLGHLRVGHTTVVDLARNVTRIEKFDALTSTPTSTFLFARSVFMQSPLFGIGPNRYAVEFMRLRDAGLRTVPVYDMGFGYLPTFFVTTGIVGALVILLFVFSVLGLLRYLKRALTLPRAEGYEVIAFTLLGIYLLFFVICSVPGVSVIVLSFVMIGGSIGSLRSAGLLEDIHVGSLRGQNDHIFVLIAIIKLIALIVIATMLWRETFAYFDYIHGQEALSRGDIKSAQLDLGFAYKRFPTPLYARDVSALALLEIGSSVHGGSVLDTRTKNGIAAILEVAKIAADEAIKLDPTDARNYVQRGAVYESIAAFGVPSARALAVDAYTAALLRDPNSPDIMTDLGRIEFADGNESKAKEWFNRALSLEPNHQGALSAEVRSLLKENNVDEARVLLIRALEFDPQNVFAAFTLGKIYYDERSFAYAARTFAAALRGDPRNVDARFYLAASLFRAGERDMALAQFKIVKKVDPGRELLVQIINAIEQGTDPFIEDPYGTTNN